MYIRQDCRNRRGHPTPHQRIIMRRAILIVKRAGKWSVVGDPDHRGAVDAAKTALKKIRLQPDGVESVAYSDRVDFKTFKEPAQVTQPAQVKDKPKKIT